MASLRLAGLATPPLAAFPLRYSEVPDSVLDKVHADAEAESRLGRQDVRLVPDVLAATLAQLAACLLVHLVESPL